MNIIDKLMKIDAGTLETPKAVHRMFVKKIGEELEFEIEAINAEKATEIQQKAIKIENGNVSDIDVYKTKEHQLKKAGEDYVLYNNTTLPTTLGSSININLIDLVSGKFVNPIKDLDDDSNCTGYVNITKTNTENYTYVPCIVCTNYSTTHASCE